MAGLDVWGDGGNAMLTRAYVWWFFRRKLKIAFLTVMTYAALC
jgi:hypothetical protein